MFFELMLRPLRKVVVLVGESSEVRGHKTGVRSISLLGQKQTLAHVASLPRDVIGSAFLFVPPLPPTFPRHAP
jgi:hypothetical protein